jgi:2-dehydro-3-deoxyphosphogluconate aldolase/(4S)-4-hydroxy-2-oxoglutarate aldolase
VKADMVARLEKLRIVPIIVIDDPDDAEPLARAIRDGGLPCAEVTFRTAAAAEALRRIADGFPDLLLGAGTVLRPDQVDAARDAGARFIVTPGLNPRVVERCQELGVPIFPGVCTPTDIETAMELGLDTLKLFPAEPIGGVAYLKAISGPYRGVRFIPTGGVDAGNLAGWLALPQVVACGGSWLARADRIRAGDYDHIRRQVEEAVAIVRSNPGG